MKTSAIKTHLKTLLFFLSFLFPGLAQATDSDSPPEVVQLSIERIPADIWQKHRIALMMVDNQLVMRDFGPGPFEDVSYWEVDFNTPLPYGRKEFLVDIEVADRHNALWDGQLLQPMINGRQAVPTLDQNGAPTTELVISDFDGKGFIPATSGTYSFQMPATDERISNFAFMTAGTENFYIKLSNFRVQVWPDVDDRVWPQRPLVSTLGYDTDKPVTLFIDWHNDEASQAQAALDLTLTGTDGTDTINVVLPRRASALSGSRVSRVDLGLLPAGNYTLNVPAIGDQTRETTAKFTVTDNKSALNAARDKAWGAFYWITSGADGPYPAAHLQEAAAQIYGAPDQTADTRGGWYDAGDYGKYSVNGAYAVSMMLLTGLVAPDALDHPIDRVANRPAAVPDWLRVADAQLNWLMKMQRADGGVYHKVASQKWSAKLTTPESDMDAKWLMPVSTAATADFAGAMSLAAAVYGQQKDPHYRIRAATFLDAAKHALDWLDANPTPQVAQVFYNGDPYGGPYTDANIADEMFFANAAYAAATGDKTRLNRALAMLDDRIAALKASSCALDWQNVDMLGMWVLDTSQHISAHTQDKVHDILRAAAYQKTVLQNRSIWNLAISDEDQLPWGSNAVFATTIWHWLLWADHSGETRYIDAAQKQMHYFFGHNPLGQTYITGADANAATAPHFLPWASGRIPLPEGMLVGGPNSADLGGDPLTGALTGRAPLRMYIDDVDSFATNEVAINWQATWALSASLLSAASD